MQARLTPRLEPVKLLEQLAAIGLRITMTPLEVASMVKILNKATVHAMLDYYMTQQALAETGDNAKAPKC
jgi:hypothetical protein